MVGELDAAAADGFCARRIRLTSDARETGPDPSRGAGQFWLVLAGAMQVADAALPALSCVFVHPDEPALAPIAGPQGAEILVMQFPRHG